MENLNLGHKKRLKEKFLKLPIRSLPDYEILEMLLFNVFPRKDTKKIAKNLLDKFSSLEKIINASSSELKAIPEVG
jgi:DNA repair protein RadC